ncbi:MAG: DUF58 domain-containing protein [Lachnospiraceae bacterium]|nr:DUF58 domain-containing protein [Lachnospiraceae bacterium]
MKRFRNITRYIFIIGLNVFVMYVFHSYINLLLLIGLILFPFYSIYGVNKVSQEMQLTLMLPEEPMERGNEFHLRFVLHNPTHFPLVNANVALIIENRFYQEQGRNMLNMPVRARKDTEVIYPVIMDYCGRFVVTAENIRLTDLLGIYEVEVPLKEVRECLVFPVGEERNQEAGQMYINGVTEAMESKEKGYDFSEVSGIREYIPGDKLQNIHWKLSVKKDELMVKERISVSAMQLNVLIEIVNDDEMCLEEILDLADSVTRAFVSQNLPFTAYYYSANLEQLREFYIGNSIERSQWLEMLLYEKCYIHQNRVEDMFISQNPSGGTYLYIGSGTPVGDSDCVISGAKNTLAELRSY